MLILEQPYRIFSGTYLIVGPDWNGQVPQGRTRYGLRQIYRGILIDTLHEIQTQQDELSRKLNEKICGDLNKFQKAMDEQKHVNFSLRKSKKSRSRLIQILNQVT